jgi:hypothetical protein
MDSAGEGPAIVGVWSDGRDGGWPRLQPASVEASCCKGQEPGCGGAGIATRCNDGGAKAEIQEQIQRYGVRLKADSVMIVTHS